LVTNYSLKLELKDADRTAIAIIGTKNGSFNFLDTRGGALMGYTNFVLNDGIFRLNIVSDKLILAGLSNNLYYFD
jgi:WD40 repeat protein